MSRSPFPVLVVDDDADLREALQGILRDEGYVVATVATAEQALEVLRAGAEPCVILLDIKMPGMDGLGFRREQLADPAISRTPVVFFTADPTEEEEARKLGVQFYLKKPVDLMQLLEVIAHYCDDPDRLESPARPRAANR